MLSHRLVRVALACAALGSVSGSLAGCVQGSGLSSDDARMRFYSVLDATEIALGGSWENRDDPTSRGCVIPLWIDGDRFPGLRISEAPGDPDTAAATVTEAWSEWDYEVDRSEIGGAIELRGQNAVDEQLVFRVTEDAMTLQGESECRPAP